MSLMRPVTYSSPLSSRKPRSPVRSQRRRPLPPALLVRPERGGARLGVAPVAARDIRAGNPDFADLPGAEPDAAVGVDDRDKLAADRAAASDERRASAGSRGGATRPARSAIAADGARHRAGAPAARRIRGRSPRPARKPAASPRRRSRARRRSARTGGSFGPHRLGAVEGDLPAGQVDPVHLLRSVALDAQIEGEIGSAGHFGAVIG